MRRWALNPTWVNRDKISSIAYFVPHLWCKDMTKLSVCSITLKRHDRQFVAHERRLRTHFDALADLKLIYESPLIDAIVNDNDIARPWCRATIINSIVYPDPQNLRWGLKEVESDCYLTLIAGRPHITKIRYTNVSMKQGRVSRSP